MYAVSWSSGKDSCLALWKAASQGLDIGYLLNTYWLKGDRGAWHGVRRELIQEQARCMRTPLLQKGIGENEYEKRFLEALLELKRKGVTAMVFGDIEPLENRGWCEKVCNKASLGSVFPLWQMDHREVVEEFIRSGFKAMIVSVDAKVLEKDFLGKEIDKDLIRRIEELRKENPSLSFCGENGEFHSFVYDGPLFKSPVSFSMGERVFRNGNWTIDLVPSPQESQLGWAWH